LLNIQALRAAAALLVVFVHLRDLEAKYSPDQILPKIFSLGIVGVDLFFVISGFIMIYVCWGLERGRRTAAAFLFARLARIYPVYWLIAGAVFFAWKLSPDLISFNPEQGSVGRSFLLIPDYNAPMLKVAWTLIHELYFYLVFSLCLFFPRRFWIGLLTFWAALIWGANQSGLCPITPGWRLVTNPINLEFYFGALIGWAYLHSGGANRFGKSALALGLGLMMVVMIYQSYFAADIYPGFGARTLLIGLPAALIVHGLVQLESRGLRASKALARSGDWSYALYLAHVPILSALFLLWGRAAYGSSPLDNLIVMPLFVGIAIGLSAAIWLGFERPILRASRRIRRRIDNPPNR
jgi:peptidoglycan/LPS O-acetylase OafA/YrhL